MNYVTGLTGRTKQTLARQLHALAMRAYQEQDERLANKLYKLYEDTLFDNYLSVQQIKNNYQRITQA